jgi:phosphate transport system substrate-binding protein
METKRYYVLGTIGLLLIGVMLFSGCTGGGEQTELKIAGSTTVQPIAIKATESYMKKNPNVKVTVQGGGSGTGIKMIGEGSVDIGASSRELSDAEKKTYSDLVVHEIAADGIAVVVNPKNNIADLTTEQIRNIFAGKIKNFKEVGGPDKEIVVVIREEGSGTRTTFEDLVMAKKANNSKDSLQKPSNGAVKATIAGNENAIGYLGIGYVDSSISAIKVGGIAPTKETVLDRTYPLSRKLYMLTKGEATGATKDFIDYILSPEGQNIVETEGFIKLA